MIVILLISILFGICIAFFCYSWYRVHTSLSRHIDEIAETPKDYGLSYETKHFVSADGINLAAWYIPVENAKAFVVLVHGYKEDCGGRPLMLYAAEFLHRAGYASVIVSLRANGESEGSKITVGVTEWQDAEAAYDFVIELPESKGKRVGFYGNSMGAATAINVVGHTGKGDFVIAGVPYRDFVSLYRYKIYKEHFPQVFLPFVLLASFIETGTFSQYFTADNLITRVHVPVLFISATYDEALDRQDAVSLFQKAHQPKYLWIANTQHEYYKDQPKETEERVVGFLDKVSVS
jgi:alpha-beta hydrolase superfamily lysophospholipase